MKGKRIIIIVHLNIPMIFADCFPNAFYAKAMPMLINFIGGQASLWIGKRIFSAGVYNCNYNKWCFGSSDRIDFSKSIRTLKKVIIINIEVSGMKTNNVRAAKDSSYTTTLNAGIMEEYNEWSYMTRRGQAVLLANNAEKVLIIVEGEKDFIVVNVLGNLSSDTYAMSNEMLEDLADVFDFAAML